ncbi:thioesterase [Rhodococcus erythropolis]|uniref:acyl-[acyl-carrier-protein] thioesterase n=1 Tax=Rhodococcus erythropolis TaxID=1833 RepID=UPI0029493D8D|nr:acyl-ACP thioesterase domain-containing protein [Rhodococcus erythropolis]MDV6278020.1 thioesterase [Rhodococcus erythropolis]
MIYRSSWPVRTGDIHPDRRVRLDAVARYLQDVAFDNLDASGAAQAHPVWVVRRTVIDVIEPIRWPATVHLSRWCSALSTRWCTMRVRLETENGGLVETEGFWININPVNGMPSRISDEFSAPLSTTAAAGRLTWRPWITDPAPTTTAGISFPLRASDIDPFHHLNNAVYWHPVEDLLRADPSLSTGRHRAVVEYTTPIVIDDTVDIRTVPGPRSTTVWFVVADNICATAHVRRM